MARQLKQVNALLQALVTYARLWACISLFGHKRLYGESAQDMMTNQNDSAVKKIKGPVFLAGSLLYFSLVWHEQE